MRYFFSPFQDLRAKLIIFLTCLIFSHVKLLNINYTTLAYREYMVPQKQLRYAKMISWGLNKTGRLCFCFAQLWSTYKQCKKSRTNNSVFTLSLFSLVRQLTTNNNNLLNCPVSNGPTYYIIPVMWVWYQRYDDPLKSGSCCHLSNC